MGLKPRPESGGLDCLRCVELARQRSLHTYFVSSHTPSWVCADDVRVGFDPCTTSSYLAVDELLRAGASRPARRRDARAHAPVDVLNENPLSQPTLSLSSVLIPSALTALCSLPGCRFHGQIDSRISLRTCSV